VKKKREDVVDASSKVLWLKFDMGNNRSWEGIWLETCAAIICQARKLKGLLNGALHRVVSEAGRISTLVRLGRSEEALLRSNGSRMCDVQWLLSESSHLLPSAIKTEKFLLTAADQESGTRDERLSRVIRTRRACSNRMTIMSRAMHGCQGGCTRIASMSSCWDNHYLTKAPP
jgi:hypothetical protein